MILKYLYNNNSINCYDKGVAVYNQYCKPLTYPITNTSLWTFTIISVTTSTTSTSTSTTSTSTSTTSTTTPSTILLAVMTGGSGIHQITTSSLSSINISKISSSESNNSISTFFCNQWWECATIGFGSFLVLAGIISSAAIWVSFLLKNCFFYS
jgi:hypothetical protein